MPTMAIQASTIQTHSSRHSQHVLPDLAAPEGAVVFVRTTWGCRHRTVALQLATPMHLPYRPGDTLEDADAGCQAGCRRHVPHTASAARLLMLCLCKL